MWSMRGWLVVVGALLAGCGGGQVAGSPPVASAGPGVVCQVDSDAEGYATGYADYVCDGLPVVAMVVGSHSYGCVDAGPPPACPTGTPCIVAVSDGPGPDPVGSTLQGTCAPMPAADSGVYVF